MFWQTDPDYIGMFIVKYVIKLYYKLLFYKKKHEINYFRSYDFYFSVSNTFLSCHYLNNKI